MWMPDVLEKVKTGVERAKLEGVVKHDEVRERLGKWLES